MLIHSIMKIMYVCPPPKKIRIVLNKKMKVPHQLKFFPFLMFYATVLFFFSHSLCPAPPVLLIPLLLLCCLSRFLSWVQVAWKGGGEGGALLLQALCTTGSLLWLWKITAHRWMRGPPRRPDPGEQTPVRKPNNSEHCQESVEMLPASSEDIPREQCGPLINVRAPLISLVS